ncbi:MULTISPECIES: ABC transporter ATP-binding protein [unclassified Fibrobacter]|uniref:ABC transporter ATP-binding protein n=1 Tax=unclassified Fibrobacter TaxID=2634177 RepID=UPI00091FE4BD|nr:MULTISPECIES: ABC transporter ATP-binding protein [Fibrobacter]MCQ2099523.1 ABC transporter ATP-binding protein [Fibrobacter sp.]MCL4102602.1 putative ABC transporter ATP-binding protein YxlF [Fibrobacter succinogenes]MDO4946281.1 ABC transporter ATP-binding protein [Fibrobacter sp.]OWV10390.1 ABC transporter ATP-binding protein [Fibrobacter sp. UWH1]SHK70439.1 ABC-2 type transport system ATP-binding protein [Fibrobacter sp. UWH5]
MIKIENLHKTYRSGFLMKPKLALKDVSFSVEPGQVYGFIGPNGAGKSTTIKVLTGLLNFDSGTVLVNGISPRDVKSRTFLGYSPEQPYFYDYLTGRELLKFYGKLVGLDGVELDKRIQWALELLHADKDWIDRRLRSYSKGMMQRVGIAQAILGKPKLLILDEPMSGLDPMGRRDVRGAIQQLNQDGVTIFYSSHLLSDVESISHRVAMIVDGKIVREGTVDEITESCGVEYHVRTRQGILQSELPEGVTPAGHPQECICADDAARDRLLRYCLEKGIAVERMEHKRPSLEDILTEEIARADV